MYMVYEWDAVRSAMKSNLTNSIPDAMVINTFDIKQNTIKREIGKERNRERERELIKASKQSYVAVMLSYGQIYAFVMVV